MILHYNTGNGSCQGNLENDEISKCSVTIDVRPEEKKK
jgi:hypothetical protein